MSKLKTIEINRATAKQQILDRWHSLSLIDRSDIILQLQSLEESIEMECGIGVYGTDSCDSSTEHSVLVGDIRTPDVLSVIPLMDIIVTSPPYNINIDYDVWSDDMSFDDYVQFTRDWVTSCHSVLSAGGRFVINIRDLRKEGGRYPAINLFYNILCEQMNYTFRGQHIWYKGREESSTAWGSWCKSDNPAIIDLYEYVFVFQKPGKRKQGTDDIEKTQFIESVLGVWKIRPVKKIRSGGKNIAHHPCPYPEELVRRVLRLYSHKGDWVLDPFAGVLSTAIAAAQVGRNSYSVDISGNYCSAGINRFKKTIGFKYDAKISRLA